MPEYKLYYFNGRGRAELARWIMKYAGFPFADERIEMDKWPEVKKDMPLGQLPVLEIDGKKLAQSVALTRYLAKEAGIAGENNLEAAFCDALADTINDMLREVFNNAPMFMENPDAVKKFGEEWIPNTLDPFSEKINKRLDGKEWFVGSKLSWADLMIACFYESTTISFPDVLNKFPNVKAHVEKILALPAIKEWIAKRPETKL